ncbi:MAG TPA: tetratricopeptide repeat protein, partial [Candidatus Obscuribacterales bacterium]
MRTADLITARLHRAILLTATLAFAVAPASDCADQTGWPEYLEQARAAQESGRLSDAEKMFRLAVDGAEKAKADAKDVAAAMNGLAAVYARQGRPDLAARMYEKSLGNLERALGQANPGLIQTMLDLGSIYESEGNHGAAATLYNRVFAINEKNFGPGHPEVARSLNRLASVRVQQGKYAQAEEHFKRAISIMEGAPAASREELATMLEEYADLLKRTNRPAEATQAEERARAARSASRQQTAKPVESDQSAWKVQLKIQKQSSTENQVDEAQKVLNQARSSGAPEKALAPVFSTLAEVYYRQSRYA